MDRFWHVMGFIVGSVIVLFFGTSIVFITYVAVWALLE